MTEESFLFISVILNQAGVIPTEDHLRISKKSLQKLSSQSPAAQVIAAVQGDRSNYRDLMELQFNNQEANAEISIKQRE